MQFSVLVLGLCSRGMCLQWRFVVVFTPVIYQKKPLKRLWWLWAWRRWNLRGRLRNDLYIWCVTVKHCLPSKLVLLKYRYLKRAFRLLSLKDFPGSRTSVQPLAITLGSQDSLSSSSVARLRNPFSTTRLSRSLKCSRSQSSMLLKLKKCAQVCSECKTWETHPWKKIFGGFS